jgi:hypothetical protein
LIHELGSAAVVYEKDLIRFANPKLLLYDWISLDNDLRGESWLSLSLK